MSEQLIQEIVEAVQRNPELGIGGAAGVLLTYVVRIFRLPVVQNVIPARFRWDKLTPVAKFLIPFAFAAVGSFVVALVAKVGWAAAVAGAITAGLTAITTHQGTKALGSSLDIRAVKKDPMAESGKWGRLGVLPKLDRDRALAALKRDDS